MSARNGMIEGGTTGGARHAETAGAAAWDGRHKVRAIMALLGSSSVRHADFTRVGPAEFETAVHLLDQLGETLTQFMHASDWLAQHLGGLTLVEYVEAELGEGKANGGAVQP